MPGFNRVHLMGHLTRDPALKYLPNQTPLVEFGLAINRKYTKDGDKREDVTFVDCASFGKGAEVINQYIKKGDPLFVEGRLKFDSWEDKNGGGKRSKLSVVVENFQFIGGREGGAVDGDDSQASAKGAGRDKFKPKAAERPFGDEPQFADDSIPF